MPFCTVNGITLPVLIDGPTMTIEEVGKKERGPDGTLVAHRTARKKNWNVRVQHTDRVTAGKYRRLLLGDGDFYPWTSAFGLYSSRGRAPLVSGGLAAAVGSSLWGNGSARISAGGADADLFIPDNGATQTNFTVGFWYSLTGVMWTSHWIYRSDGQNFSNGVATGSSLSDWFSYTGSAIRLEGHGSNDHYYGDLFILPFQIPDSWASMIYGSGGAGGMGYLPAVRLGGDIVFDEQATTRVDVMCEIESSEISKAALTSGGRQAVHVTRAKLQEI